MPTTLPKDNTKIQLKTKTSSAEDKSLSDIALDVGEPLVNTNDKTLVIGTANNKNADDDSAIVLGAGKLVVNSTSESTEDAATALSNGNVHINHIENNKALSSHKISGARSVKVTADTNADITVSADFELSSPAGKTKDINKVPVQLTDIENPTSPPDEVNIAGIDAVKVYSTTANEILVSADFELSSEKSIAKTDNAVSVTLTDKNQNSTDTFSIQGDNAIRASSDASGNIILSAGFELYTDKSAEATNGVNVYLKDIENNALDNSSGIDEFNIKGSGATAVTSDARGNIDINTEYSLTATQQTGEKANASDIKLDGDSEDDIVTIKGGDYIGITTAGNVITISDTASYDRDKIEKDTNASNLEYITEVTQIDGQISAKKKTLQGINKISITTDAEGKTTVADVANVTDTTYTKNDSKYVAKVTQTNGIIAYEKHTIEGGDKISVSTSGGKTTISNTATLADAAEDNEYVSEVDQDKGEITVRRRTILEDTINDTSTATTNGNVEVITSFVKPTTTSEGINHGIIPKMRTIKGDKGIKVIVGNDTSDIIVQHTTTVKGSDGKVDEDGKASTSQTSDKTAITNGGTFTISDVNYDAQGHVTSENTATLTVPKYSGGTGISIALDSGKTNEYTITNSASVNSTTNNTTTSKDYIVSVSGSNGSVTPTKKVLTAGTGITITTGTGSTEEEKTKLTIGHTNNLTFTGTATTATAQTSTLSEVTDGKFTVPKVTYDKQGHITSKDTTEITIAKAAADKFGLVRTNYSSSGAEIKLDVDPDGDAYIALTKSAISAAGGVTGITAGTGLSSTGTAAVTLNVNPGTGIQIPTDNKVTLKTASTGEIGGIKIYQDNSSYTVEAKTSSISKNVSTDNYRAVEIDKNDKAFVYIPNDLLTTVTQTSDTDTNSDIPILLKTVTRSGSAGNAKYCDNVKVNPKEGQLTAKKFNAASDARLKENFEPLTVEKSILDLPTYKFDFINGPKNQIGCKAQDLQEICPEIVDENSAGYLSIQESKIVYLLLEEVKKLKAEIEILKGRG